MKYLTFATCTTAMCAIFLSSCASGPPPPNFQAVKFTTSPAEAALTVYEPGYKNIIATCITPCSLQIDTDKTQVIKIVKDGYETHTSKKPTFPMVRSPFFPQGYVAASMGIEIKLYTPAEAILKKKEDAKKARALQKKIVEWRSLMVGKIDDNDIARPEGAVDNPDDKDAQALVRIPPIYPPKADKSGHCMIKFDVTPKGQPTLVKALTCSDDIFAAYAINAVRHWKYEPKVVNGENVRRYGVQSKLIYRLLDARGKPIPE